MANEIIDWSEAMQQCGDDEEFLRELLSDLRSEMEGQLSTIIATIQNPSDAPFNRIMRAAHAIKGAAANLMCSQLRTAALNLEMASRQAEEAGGTSAPFELQNAVNVRVTELQQAAQNYAAYLHSIGI